MTPTISIGPLTLHLYGFLMALAALMGWYLAKNRAHFYKISPELFETYYVLVPIISGLIGARIYHVLDYWQVYKENLISILYIQNGGLGIWGGIIGIGCGVFIVCRLRKLNFLSTLDLLSPSVAIAQAVGRVGNWVNQEGFGPPTNLPWKIYIDPQNRPLNLVNSQYFHPTFFYEAILDILVFLLLVYFAKKFKKPGQTFGLYLIFYSITRFFLEFLRIDTWIVGELKIAQLISVLAIITGSYLFIRAKDLEKGQALSKSSPRKRPGFKPKQLNKSP